MPWHGPYRIDYLLSHTLGDAVELPPDNGTVYVLTLTKEYKQEEVGGLPNVLYVGGRKKQNRFRIRVGDLIADMLGFFSEHRRSRHCAGPRIRAWCQENKIDPSRLYLWWKTRGCARCEEIAAFDELEPALNKIKPQRCSQHNRDAEWDPRDC